MGFGSSTPPSPPSDLGIRRAPEPYQVWGSPVAFSPSSVASLLRHSGQGVLLMSPVPRNRKDAATRNSGRFRVASSVTSGRRTRHRSKAPGIAHVREDATRPNCNTAQTNWATPSHVAALLHAGLAPAASPGRSEWPSAGMETTGKTKPQVPDLRIASQREKPRIKTLDQRTFKWFVLTGHHIAKQR